MNYRDSVTNLNKKFEWLALRWGDTYHVKAGVVLDRGTLWIRKREKKWIFMWEAQGQRLVPLQSAPVEARLDAAHALPDLLREMQNNHTNRVIDIDEAHSILDDLLQDAKQ